MRDCKLHKTILICVSITYTFVMVCKAAVGPQTTVDSLTLMQMLAKADRIRFSQPDTAMFLIREVYAKAGDHVFLKGQGSIMLGLLYQQKREYMSARKYYMEALKWREKWGDPALLAVNYMLLSENHAHLHQFHEAMEYGHKAAGLMKYSLNQNDRQDIYLHLGVIHSWANDDFKKRDTFDPVFSLDSALFYFELAKKIPPSSPAREARLHYLLGITYLHLLDSRAIESFNMALAMERELEQTAIVIVDLLQFLAMAHLNDGNFKAARVALKEASEMYSSNEMNDDFLLTKICWVYVDLYKKMGDYKNAFYWIQEANKARDRRFLVDREGAISRLTVEYETEKKEAMLLQQQNALKREQQIRWFIMAGTLFVLCMSGVFFYLYRKNRELSRYNAALVKEQGHRVKNNLQRLTSLMGLQLAGLDDGAAKQLFQENLDRVHTIALLHRQLSDDSGREISLPNYLEQLVEGIKKVYAVPHVNVEYQIESITLSGQQALSLGLIVNEVVTNAFKHAFANTNAPKLKIALSKTLAEYYLIVKDNGSGSQGLPDPESIGLHLIALLVKELKGIYHLNQHEGTNFELRFPVV